jgi:hypothetical protein
MRSDIALAGFVLTPAEWDSMDVVARVTLLAVALRRDEPWIASAPAHVAVEADAYESYQLVYA